MPSSASPLNLVPCASYSGLGTGEIGTVVDRAGTVHMGPLYTDLGLQIARSPDQGATWNLSFPRRADGTSHVRVQPCMNIDPTTDRIFFHTGRSSIATLTLKTGFDLSLSDNGCAASEYVLFGDGAVAPDGRIYIGGRRCQSFGVAMSADEGKTWKMISVPGSKLIPYTFVTNVPFNPNYVIPTPITVDSAGHVYAVWPDEHNLLRLSISRDRGTTWSTPVVISDPKVKAVNYPAVTVKSPGTVAVAHYGSEDGKRFNGHMAESIDALTGQPVFKSQTVNDPAFTQDMCPWDICRADWDVNTHAHSKWQAVLGRLVHH